ncbi:DsrE family protein [Lichenicoccus sp.]|uniref:DsrE family protein n=1 Tax=Lichenicoccus sp. TaxID=2781899 RepID=UPI003D0BBDF5
MPSEGPLGLILLDGGHARAHFAFSFAASAAALDRPVTLFAANAGIHALCRDWRGLSGDDHDAVLRARGVAGFESLRSAAVDLGVRLLACEAALKGEAVEPSRLLEAVEVAGITRFLADLAGAQIVSF